MKQYGKIALALLLVGAAGGAWYALRTPQAPLEQPAPTPSAADATPSAANAEVAAEEQHLLTGAEAALGSGDTDRAFSLLYEHATKFPKGKLANLRQVVHVQTLCRVGKAAEASEEAAAFLAQNPDSPLAMHVRGPCAALP